ncbi:MAG TPA: acyltransferase, partial [Aliiroseovarius sp.]|nr:acyltransferase [Aliiroseovarius sp.]
MAYRPEIDGLRAIAVLAVVAYHFGLPHVGGGLVGVDIFFVISGFLIGGILIREHANSGHIRLGHFYLRRIRRLAPAYFAMAAASLLASWFILLPFEMREFGKELIAATTYLANIHFFRETGYFDIGIENKVLLHTWSLAVEEQFYMVLPFVILLAGRSKRLLMPVLVGAFLLSLVAEIWLTYSNQSAAFYLFPLRAWELLAGVLLAAFARRPGPRWAAGAGVALMLAGIIWVRPGAGFPGWQATVPVAGAVLALWGGQAGGAVNRALASPAPVFFGRISYSLYLWHWPVLALSKYWRGGYSGPLEAALWALLALSFSVISWRFIEQPVRKPGLVRTRMLVFGWLLGSLALLGAGTVIYKGNGLAGRFAPTLRTHIEASGDFLQDWSRCEVESEGTFAGVSTCRLGPEGTPQVLVWGDSHLRPLAATLDALAWQAETPALLVWVAGCPPLFGVSKRENTTNAAEDAACSTALARLQAAVSAQQLPPRLLLVGRWSYYAEGRGVGRDAANRITLSAPYADAMTATLAELAAVSQVFVLRQPPEIPAYGSRDVARALASGRLEPAGARARAQ